MKPRTVLTMLAAAAMAVAQNSPPLPGAGNVTLPLDEYNRLLEAAAKPPKRADTPPLPYALRSAQLNLAVTGQTVSGSVLLDGEVFAAGPVKAPLVTGMILRNGQQKGKDLPIVLEGGTPTAVVSGPAEFALTLETALPLTVETGRASFNLTAPSAGAVRLSLSVPGAETSIHLSPGLITNQVSRDGRTLVEATLAPGQTANVWWAARLTVAPPAPPKETRFLSDVKTLISVNETDLTVATLANLTIVQGEPAEFRAKLPEGFEFTGATGASVASAAVQQGSIVLTVSASAARTHQFLVSFVRAGPGTTSEVPLLAFTGAQRETGEVLVEAEGNVELTATGAGGLRRMDLKETSPALRSLGHGAVQAAFRYQKRAAEAPAVALQWIRFPDTSVLSAMAQNAVVTTLVTSEGRSLTEVKLTIRNQAQPFLKLTLPAGASILTADVAGEKVKPLQGADGSRVPLLRPGFRPPDSYTVSFVFLHSGAAFDKKGSAQLELPRMDVPVAVMEWEVFLPQQYRVAEFGGDAIAARLMAIGAGARISTANETIDSLAPGQIAGVVTDPSTAGVGKASVTVLHLASGATFRASTDPSGRWTIANVPSGRVRVTTAAVGFQNTVRAFDHDAARGSRSNVVLQVGSVAESVEVTAQSGAINQSQQVERAARQNAAAADTAASANVADLQRRVVGVLPIQMNVPKAGNAYNFVRPLVVDEATTLTFNYRRK